MWGGGWRGWAGKPPRAAARSPASEEVPVLLPEPGSNMQLCKPPRAPGDFLTYLLSCRARELVVSAATSSSSHGGEKNLQLQAGYASDDFPPVLLPVIFQVPTAAVGERSTAD